jgi:eukaryotic-like serine/threonine-protein kinase
VVVSSGPDLGTVPDVVGRTLGQATSQVSQAGFRVRAVRVASSDEEGTVVAQNPLGGARVNRGTVVRLNVSRGSGGSTATVTTTSSLATVPDTVGQDQATAQATLEGAGFTVRVVDQPTTSTEQDGIVVRQAPEGGGTARTGSTISIFVGRLS